MSAEKHKQRLDEILIKDGLISEAQIKEALLRQKALGGRFGSQLLCLGYIDESQLVRALSTQLGCEGVVLSNLKISHTTLKTIPKEVALARKVIPFEYDSETDILKIASEDPTDQNLIKELDFVACGKDVKLFVAAGIALNRAIAKYYLGRDISWDDGHLLEMSDAATGADKSSLKTGADAAILLVTDEPEAARLLQSLLEKDGFRVVITDTTDEAIQLLGDETFSTVFLKDTVSGDYPGFAARMREVSPHTVIRRHETTSSLLFGRDTDSVTGDQYLENLDLFTSLLSSKAKLPNNHGGQVGRYAGKLCWRLGLADQDRLTITNAAYVHELARFYYSRHEAKENRQIVQLTIRLLESLNYSPEVLEMLRSMYINLPKEHSGGVPIQVLGGNILTIVDIFCHSISQNDCLSLYRFDAVKTRLRELVGKLLLSEVVDAFVEMIQKQLFDLRVDQKALQVMIYSRDLSLQQALESRLKSEGFGVISQSSPASLIQLYRRREPDMMILVVPGEPDNIKLFTGSLAEGGVSFRRTPTFLLTDSSLSPLFSLFEEGIEDIITLDDNLNFLFSKIHKLEIKICARATTAGEIAGGGSGSRGRLADVDLIKLLQILGSCQKSIRITVQSSEPSAAPLVLYLNRGQILFAQLKNQNGAEAVYEAFDWRDGTWIVESVAAEELPPPNNDLSTESILTQGCLLLDKKARVRQLL